MAGSESGRACFNDMKYPRYFVNPKNRLEHYICHVMFRPKSDVYVYYDNRPYKSYRKTIKDLKSVFSEISASELALMKGSVPIDNSN